METKAGLCKEAITPILEELKAGLEQLYGPKLRRPVLFGSYARGEAEPGSDIDVAVVLDDYERDVREPWEPVHFRILQDGSQL